MDKISLCLPELSIECQGLEYCLPGDIYGLGGMLEAIDQMKQGLVERAYRFSIPHSAVLALMTKDFHTFTVGEISVPTFSNFSIIILRFWRNITNWNSQIFPNIFLRQYLNSFSLNQTSQFRQDECSVANNLNLFNNILRFVFRVTHLQLLNNIDRKPFLNNLISPDVPLLSCLFVRLHLG